MKHIGFNKPYLTGLETQYIIESVASGKISGDGIFSKKCHDFFEKNLGFRKTLLTTSCTDALEMCAILLDIKPGDEVIAPSYTFVSTVNAFILRGAKIQFADSNADNPNIDPDKIEHLINEKTKAVIVVHYAGISCDMKKIVEICKRHNIKLIEDAAQAISAFHEQTALGSFGDLAAFSFHETKNIISGEGGLLVINDESLIERAEIIREKGTNRSKFFRGEIDKYGWVDVGSSFLPSDIIAAFLFAQLQHLDKIQERRMELWNIYFSYLQELSNESKIKLPKIPPYSKHNAHMFYIICNDLKERTDLISHLKSKNINAVFHYLSLHKSEFHLKNNKLIHLPYCDLYSDCLLRLPLYYELSKDDISRITNEIHYFYNELEAR